MEDVLEGRRSRKYVQSLAQSIQSLTGFKAYLTSAWAESVCHIIKALPSDEPSGRSYASTQSFRKAAASQEKDDGSDLAISKVQDDLAALHAQLDELNSQRRQTLNEYLDSKGNIRVFCRVRPTLEGERGHLMGPVLNTDSSNVFLKLAENKRKRYCFDKVFEPHSTQDEVFSEIEPVIKSALDGHNACVFAYGQTGTGKTFTMAGKPECPGVVLRAMETLFEQGFESSRTFFTFSMLEIYMGNLRDLLVPQATKVTDPSPLSLQIKMDTNGGIEIDNLAAIRVSDVNQAKKLYRLGSRSRSTASTNSNASSSRSHCLIRILVTRVDAAERQTGTSKIWMVDLGGSERLPKTWAKGRRLEEGKAINLTLSALGDVVSALQTKKRHVPYRNSKLTQLLRDSLGENAKTIMLVHVSPKEEDLCETVCSLGFAMRVRSIQLGQEESAEGRAKKELAMCELLRKVKKMESASHDVKKDIDRLNARLKQLAGMDPLANKQLEVSSGAQEEPKPNMENKKQRFKLPRFMRPTICSRRKSGTEDQSFEDAKKREPVATRRTKASSLRAESVSFPINDISKSEYGSDVMSFNSKYSADNYGTECSHDAERNVQRLVSKGQEKPPRSLASSVSCLSHESIGEQENKLEDTIVSDKHLNIEKWVLLQKKRTNSTHIYGGKRVLTIPLPEQRNTSNLPRKPGIGKAAVPQSNVENSDVTKVHKDDFVDKALNRVRGDRNGESYISSPIGTIKFEESQSTSIPKVDMTNCLSNLGTCCNQNAHNYGFSDSDQTLEIPLDDAVSILVDGANQMETPVSNKNRINGSTDTEDSPGILANMDRSEKPSLHSMRHRRALFTNHREGKESFRHLDAVVRGTGDDSYAAELGNHDIAHLSDEDGIRQRASSECALYNVKGKEEKRPTSTATMMDDMLHTNKNSNLLAHKDEILKSSREISLPADHLDSVQGTQLFENGDRTDPCCSPKHRQDDETSYVNLIQSQSSLIEDEKETSSKDYLMSMVKFQDRTGNKGTYHLVQKFRTFYASALLGFGVWNIGLGHDFFHGLTL